MAMKMCATIQLEERQANVEGELAGVKQKMENMVTMSRVESIAVRKVQEILAQKMAQRQVTSTHVRLFLRGCRAWIPL